MHQVGNAFVRAQFDHLRVDHEHLDLIGAAGHQDRQDQRVQADTLAGSRSSGDQQVRQTGQVYHQRPAAHILAQEDGDPLFGDVRRARLDQLAQTHHDLLVVGHFDAHRILAGNGSHHAYGGDSKRDGQIVGQRRHFRQPQAGLKLQFELCDYRAGVDFDNMHVQTELLERLLQRDGGDASLLSEQVVGEILGDFQQVSIRQLEFLTAGSQGNRLKTLDDLLA